ncbi:FHA domain-containing protein [Microbacterium sp. 10M-3C3]|uniref:FHA domain-containing protein n=1 Tax=Microbacterium sp. 10M-3C3 TaxID=2483401 RepID=UPI000F640104|nr:FHA domain-containing protein [Microbacterium sp. 10M-3C3]
MSLVRYAPGSSVAVVTPQGAALLDAATPASVAEAVWERLADDGGLGGLVDALAAGGPPSAVPPFAVVLAEGEGWRVAVRGAFAVTAGDERIDGAGASTWTERTVRGAESVTLASADAAPHPPSEGPRPLRDGIAGAASLAVVRDGASAAPGAATAAEPAPSRPAAVPVEPVQPHSIREVHDLPAEPAPAPAVAEPAAPAPTSSDAADALIDSVPIVSVPAAPRPVAPAPPAAVVTGDLPPTQAMPAVGADGRVSEGLDAEVEATVIRDGAPAAPAGDAPEDDATISLAEARAMRASGALPPVAPPLAPTPPPVAAGVLRVSSGQSVLLDRTVIVGRRPRSTRASGADLPHLVAVDSPQQDISRNHLEVRVEGDTILATDLQTTNGTTLLRRGAEPSRLHPGEATVVVPGDVLDLGDGITIAVEAAP